MPKQGDHFENDEYVISSAVGHLVGLQMPEDIDKEKYGFWRLETLPIIPEKFELQPIPGDSKSRFDQLKKLLARKGECHQRHQCLRRRPRGRIDLHLYLPADEVQKALSASVDVLDDERGY